MLHEEERKERDHSEIFILHERWVSLDWSHQVEYLSLSRVLDLKSVESSWNFFEKVLSQIEKLNSRTQIELRSLTQQLNSKTRLNSTRY